MGKYEGDFFGWEPTVESIGSNYFVGKLTSIAAKRESLALAWAVQGPLAEAVFSFSLSSELASGGLCTAGEMVQA